MSRSLNAVLQQRGFTSRNNLDVCKTNAGNSYGRRTSGKFIYVSCKSTKVVNSIRMSYYILGEPCPIKFFLQ